MALTHYQIDFSKKPAIESADIRKKIDRLSWCGLDQNLQTGLGEFMWDSPPGIESLEIPSWIECHQL